MIALARLGGMGTTRILALRDRATGHRRLGHAKLRQLGAGECVRLCEPAGMMSRARASAGMHSAFKRQVGPLLIKAVHDATHLRPETIAIFDAAHPPLDATVPIHTQQTLGEAVGHLQPDLLIPPMKLQACNLQQLHDDRPLDPPSTPAELLL
jgi:hypothetical protein